MPHTTLSEISGLYGAGILVKGKKEDRWLPLGNQRDDDNALPQKNQPESPLHDEMWYQRDHNNALLQKSQQESPINGLKRMVAGKKLDRSPCVLPSPKGSDINKAIVNHCGHSRAPRGGKNASLQKFLLNLKQLDVEDQRAIWRNHSTCPA